MEGDPRFREVQRFRQSWIWGLLGGIALLMLVLDLILWGGLAIVVGVAGLIYSLRLHTEVRIDGIYFKMWPIHRSFRQISWSEIKHYESKQYGPLREFGGWGIRWIPGKIAYNVSGSQGVWVERKDERSILIGSQRPEEFVKAISEAVQ